MMQRVLRILSRLDFKHDEHRRARISRGYKAGELQPHYLIQLKYKKCGRDRSSSIVRPINRTTKGTKARKRVRTIGKIIKEMKWVMGTNESARTKGKHRHGKEISPRMSKDRGI